MASLSPAALHLWRLPLNLPPATQAVVAGTLTPNEHARATRYHFEADGRHFAAARGQLRQVLAVYTGLLPERVPIAADAYGKPHLALDQPDLHFNLAHSGAWGLVVVARLWPVGVDLEHVRPSVERATIAQRFFALGEARRLAALPPSEQLAAFFRCWTRKEAYIKARGGGLSLPLDEFEVSLEADAPRVLWVKNNDAEAAQWKLFEPPLPPEYVGAVAVRAREVELVDRGDWAAEACRATD